MSLPLFPVQGGGECGMGCAGNLHENVIKLRFELDRVQSDLDLDPFNNDLRDEEAIYVCAFMDALIMEERFLKQKSKVEWLRFGDSNSAYFYKSVKGRVNRNHINVVTDLARDMVTGDGVLAAFVSHYEAFLCQQGSCFPFDSQELFLNRLDSNQALDMIKNVTTKEEFFTNGKLLKELNHTIIALIPKIISNRIKESLKMLISPNQSAFVPGRRISDNILLTQELMHNYHLDHGPWIWPSDWYSKYPILNSLATPNLLDVDDRLEWRDRVGVVKPFSVAAVWDSLKELAGLLNVADSITVIVDSIIPFAKRTSV
ncbi:hypothetical protein Tco_0560920 [Tanacetum coccineum]